MDSTKKPCNVLSLCTGYGGIERGLERVLGRLNILVNVEIETFALANLVNKMETNRMDSSLIWTDVKTFPAHIFRGYVDLLIGGYPCQPFSAAGKRLGDKDPRHLWPFIQEHVQVIQPKMVFLENVEGHLSKGVAEVLADLEEMAYRVECGVFSAAEISAPHQRKRVFILGYSKYDGLSSPENWRGFSPEQEERGLQEFTGGCCEELAESSGEGLQKAECSQKTRNTRITHHGKWPARPGQPQFDWEEPRVLAVKPELGGAVDGITDRVDRLRLLGNGVVPQTAEKAFRVLYGKLVAANVIDTPAAIG